MTTVTKHMASKQVQPPPAGVASAAWTAGAALPRSALNSQSTRFDRTTSVRCLHDRPACESCGVKRLCLQSTVDGNDVALSDFVQNRIALKRGSFLLRAGKPFAALYAIQAGSIKTYRPSADGHECIAGFSVPGEIVGMDAIGQGHYPYDAIALEDTRVCVLSYEQLRAWAVHHPRLQAALFNIMSRALLRAETRMQLSGMSAEQKVIRFLRDFFERIQQWLGPADEVYLPMSREDIANYLGLALETVSRMFTRLRDQRIIGTDSRGSRHIQILRPEMLTKLAGEDLSVARESRQGLSAGSSLRL